jgi:hypothetical protein
MNTQSPLTISSLPLWVESYPTGYINMKTKNISTYKPDILKYKYAIDTSKQIMNTGDNTSIKIPQLSSKEVTLKKTTPLEYEEFIGNQYINIQNEKFILPLNMMSHTNPIWVLIIFLIAIWIIFFLVQ